MTSPQAPTRPRPPDWLVVTGPTPQRNSYLRASRLVAGTDRATVAVEPGATTPSVYQSNGRLTVVGGRLFDDSTEPAEAISNLAFEPEALAATHGLYATVVVEQDGSITAWRDHLGRVPLFHTTIGDCTLLSPSIHTLRRAGCPTDVDRNMLAAHLVNMWVFPERSYFEGIDRVPMGRMASINNGVAELRRYWDPKGSFSGYRTESADELIDEFGDLLDRVVADLVSPGPSAIFLSGGLDSIAVATAAAPINRKQHGRALVGLSALFPTVVTDESAIQRRVGRALELDHHLVTFDALEGERTLLAGYVDFATDAPAPVLNPWVSVYDELARIGVDEGCTTLLTGGGGDEWLTVDPFYFSDLMRSGRLREAVSFARSINRSYRLSTPHLIRNLLIRETMLPLAKRTAYALAHRSTTLDQRLVDRATRRRMSSWPEWFAPDLDLRRALERGLRAALPDRLAVATGGYFDAMFSTLDTPFVELEMEEWYYRGRRAGIDPIEPFWDPRLIEFLAAVPPNVLCHGERTKGLVRSQLDQRFPDTGLLEQKKVHATTFFQDVIRDQVPAIWQELSGPQKLVDLEICGPPAFDAINDLADPGRSPYHAHWLISLEAWLRNNA